MKAVHMLALMSAVFLLFTGAAIARFDTPSVQEGPEKTALTPEQHRPMPGLLEKDAVNGDVCLHCGRGAGYGFQGLGYGRSQDLGLGAGMAPGIGHSARNRL